MRVGAGKVSYHKAQRMPAADLVIAVRNREQGLCALDTAPQELEEVECRLVGPVHVLKNHQGRSTALKFIERGSEHGRDVEDWLAAETELTRRREALLSSLGSYRPATRQRPVSAALQLYAATATSASTGAARDISQLSG